MVWNRRWRGRTFKGKAEFSAPDELQGTLLLVHRNAHLSPSANTVSIDHESLCANALGNLKDHGNRPPHLIRKVPQVIGEGASHTLLIRSFDFYTRRVPFIRDNESTRLRSRAPHM
jgi:hypothetical protein